MDSPVELVDHGGFAMSAHHHLLFAQLFGHVLGRAAGHIDPRLGEEGARPERQIRFFMQAVT